MKGPDNSSISGGTTVTIQLSAAIDDLRAEAKRAQPRLFHRRKEGMEAWCGALAWRIYVVGVALIPVGLFLAILGGRTLPGVLLLLVQLCGLLGLVLALIESVAMTVALWRRETPMWCRGSEIRRDLAAGLRSRHMPCIWDEVRILLLHEKERTTARSTFLMTLLGLLLAFFLAGSTRDLTDILKEATGGDWGTLSWWFSQGILFAAGITVGSVAAFVKTSQVSRMLELVDYIQLQGRT